MLSAMLFIPHYLNMRINTVPEFMKRRFGGSCYRFISYYALFTTVVTWLGSTLYTGSLLTSQIMGWPFWVSALVLTAIATSFTVAGGLAAVVITDAFQSVLMIVGAVTLTVIACAKIGSIEHLIESVPPKYWRLIRPAGDAHFPWHAMFLGYPVLAIWFWCTDQTIIQRVLGTKDLRNGQLGAVLTGYLKILPPLIFLFPGILCYVLHPNLENSDRAFVTMVDHYLPVGMVGLIIAVLIAAVVTTLDSALNSFSTVFTLDIYVRKFRPEATPAETKWIGRVVTCVAACIAVGYALFMAGVGKEMFDLFSTVMSFISPTMAAVFMVGILWKRATAKAALATLVLGTAVSLPLAVCHLKDWPSASEGVLTLSGKDTVENYEKVLGTVEYMNQSENPTAAPRALALVADPKTPGRRDLGAVALEVPAGGTEMEAMPIFPDAPSRLDGLEGGHLHSLTLTLENLEDGADEVLSFDTRGTNISGSYNNHFWPHYLFFAFLLFAGLGSFMIVVSLLTKKSPEQEDLPTMKEAYANQDTKSGGVWVLWGILAVIMVSLYAFFELLPMLTASFRMGG